MVDDEEFNAIAACECAQDMIQFKQVLTSLNFKVKLPMTVCVGNK